MLQSSLGFRDPLLHARNVQGEQGEGISALAGRIPSMPAAAHQLVYVLVFAVCLGLDSSYQGRNKNFCKYTSQTVTLEIGDMASQCATAGRAFLLVPRHGPGLCAALCRHDSNCNLEKYKRICWHLTAAECNANTQAHNGLSAPGD